MKRIFSYIQKIWFEEYFCWMKDFCNDVYNPQKVYLLAFLDSYLSVYT